MNDMPFLTINFLMVLLFNLYWLGRYGLKTYLEAFKWDPEFKWLCILIRPYAIWGIISLFFIILNIIK